MSDALLTVHGLKKSFRRLFARPVDALKGVSFEIPPGTVTGFLGANGAGKTTAIKCLLGLAIPDEGEIRFFGQNELAPEVKSRIGFLPERPYFYEYLTGREFLRFYGQLSGKFTAADLRQRIDKLLERVGLKHAADRPLRGYSKGMLQRIGIAQALVNDPDFIILDEPMTGLDPDGRYEVSEIIRATAKGGTAVFFSSHLLPDAERLCDRLVILKKGELVYQGSTSDFLGKTAGGYQLVTSKDGVLHTEICPSLEELNRRIDAKRAVKETIVEVRANRLTLEEAFVRIGLERA